MRTAHRTNLCFICVSSVATPNSLRHLNVPHARNTFLTLSVSSAPSCSKPVLHPLPPFLHVSNSPVDKFPRIGILYMRTQLTGWRYFHSRNSCLLARSLTIPLPQHSPACLPWFRPSRGPQIRAIPLPPYSPRYFPNPAINEIYGPGKRRKPTSLSVVHLRRTAHRVVGTQRGCAAPRFGVQRLQRKGSTERRAVGFRPLPASVPRTALDTRVSTSRWPGRCR